jgi:putative transposase
VAYIDAHRHDVVDGREVGVEPICAVLKKAGLQIAPSSYHAARARPPSARAIRAAELVTDIKTTHKANPRVHGAPKVHAELKREGVSVRPLHGRAVDARRRRARDPTEETHKNTVGDGAKTDRSEDLVKCVALGPNQLWVADLTYVCTHAA